MPNPAPDGGVKADAVALFGSEITLAQVLKRAGYATSMSGRDCGPAGAGVPTTVAETHGVSSYDLFSILVAVGGCAQSHAKVFL